MGQNLNSMNQNQSKNELLYQLAISGNVEAIKAICREGANLEWIDEKGRTPLIVVCMDSGLFNVAKTLIDMGANVNAYRPGRNAGTPLHHAAKRGLEQTVKLLLSSGANPLMRNDDCNTALDVARIRGHTNIVRAIEKHICYFSGWLREFYGPGFLEALAPQFLSRKIWVVVIPCGSGNPAKSPRLELSVYATLQDAQPRTVISLWEAKIEEPKFNQADPVLIILDQSTKTRYKFASGSEGDKQQLLWLYEACQGTTRVMPLSHHDTQATVSVIGDQSSAEAVGLATAITPGQSLSNAHQRSEATNSNGWANSVNIDSHNGWGPAVESTHASASSSGWLDVPVNGDYNGWGGPNSADQTSGPIQTSSDTPPAIQTTGQVTSSVSSAPSAPPIPDEAVDEGPIHYPSIDSSPVDFFIPAIEHGATNITSNVKDEGGSSSCIICWEAPVEGACIPCGHMAGCMVCLTEIKAKKGVCPVCRANINQVIRLYAV